MGTWVIIHTPRAPTPASWDSRARKIFWSRDVHNSKPNHGGKGWRSELCGDAVKIKLTNSVWAELVVVLQDYSWVREVSERRTMDYEPSAQEVDRGRSSHNRPYRAPSFLAMNCRTWIKLWRTFSTHIKLNKYFSYYQLCHVFITFTFSLMNTHLSKISISHHLNLVFYISKTWYVAPGSPDRGSCTGDLRFFCQSHRHRRQRDLYLLQALLKMGCSQSQVHGLRHTHSYAKISPQATHSSSKVIW